MLAGWVGRNHCFDAAVGQPITKAVGVVSPVGEQPSRRSDCRQQIACGRQIMAIAGCDQEGDGAPSVLGQGMDFCGAPAAERWALMCVESIDIVPMRPVEPVSA
jgi:hypothetical protein